MNKSGRLAVVSFLVGFVIVSGVEAASANSSADGTVSYFGPVGGYNYKDYNTIYISSYASGQTDVAENGNGNVPAGNMGIKPRVFHDNGTLCKAAPSITYNSSPANEIESGTAAPSCGVGSYYSDGFSYEWTGSSYSEHNTLRTKSLTLS